jgi:potassium-transporting ATPase A subunit
MVVMLGYMVGRRKLAVVIFATMLAMYLPMVIFGVAQEAGGNLAIAAMRIDQSTGSMEGKEVRFGAGLSALWAVTTTVTSNGSVKAMHDSLTPLGGLMPLTGMWLNNIVGRHCHPRAADVHAGCRARADCRAPGAAVEADLRSAWSRRGGPFRSAWNRRGGPSGPPGTVEADLQVRLEP